VKASLFPNSATLVLIALALGSLRMGQPYRPLSDARPRAHANQPVYDLLITNAHIIDGRGNPWFRADVAVRDVHIVRIGRARVRRARFHSIVV
jgi:hypothetical protein